MNIQDWLNLTQKEKVEKYLTDRKNEYLAAVQTTQSKEFSEYVARANFALAMQMLSRKEWLNTPMKFK